MLFILQEKLYNKYKTFTNISKIIGESSLLRLNKGQHIYFYVIYRKVNLKDEINYTYFDFLIDYEKDIEIYIEKKIVYNIWKSGSSFQQAANLCSISRSSLILLLQVGMYQASYEVLGQIYIYIDISIPQNELSNFTLIIKVSFCKLIGDKTELEAFKNKFHIPYPVLPYSNSWHLAFDGYIFKIIKQVFDF